MLEGSSCLRTQPLPSGNPSWKMGPSEQVERHSPGPKVTPNLRGKEEPRLLVVLQSLRAPTSPWANRPLRRYGLNNETQNEHTKENLPHCSCTVGEPGAHWEGLFHPCVEVWPRLGFQRGF